MLRFCISIVTSKIFEGLTVVTVGNFSFNAPVEKATKHWDPVSHFIRVDVHMGEHTASLSLSLTGERTGLKLCCYYG